MTVELIEETCVALMALWLPDSWKFRFVYGSGLTFVGRCTFPSREIQINGNLVECLTPDLLREICLHEIAHALDFETKGDTNHGEDWRSNCIRIGLDNPRDIVIVSSQNMPVTIDVGNDGKILLGRNSLSVQDWIDLGRFGYGSTVYELSNDWWKGLPE